MDVQAVIDLVSKLGPNALLGIAVYVLGRKCEALLAENAKLRDDRISEQAALLRIAAGHQEDK